MEISFPGFHAYMIILAFDQFNQKEEILQLGTIFVDIRGNECSIAYSGIQENR